MELPGGSTDSSTAPFDSSLPSVATPTQSLCTRSSTRQSIRDALPQLVLPPLHDSMPPMGDDEWDTTVSFSCGGWFMMYFFGAAHALVDSGMLSRWEQEGRRVRFCGASAGSLAACCLASGQYDFESVRDFAVLCANDFRSSVFNLFKMKRYLEEAIVRLGEGLRLLDHDPIARAKMESGCLEVNLTMLPRMNNRVMNSFSRYEQIHEALIASCCMVPLVGMPFRLKETGEWVTDGGFSNFTPRMNEPNVISVSAMYFQDASVRPRIFVPSWWALFPPSEKKYRNLFWMGYNDMIDSLVGLGEMDANLGEYLLKPEMDFKIHDTYLDVFVTGVMEVMMLIWVRPVVVTCVYVELFLSMGWYFLKSVFAGDRRRSIRAWYDNLRSATSLRTLGRLLFGAKIPNNEERLSKGSVVFRMFDPIALGGNKRTGRECWSPSGSPLGRAPTLSPTARQSSYSRR